MKAATQKHPRSNRTEQLLQQRGEYLEEIEQLEARVQAWKPNSLN